MSDFDRSQILGATYASPATPVTAPTPEPGLMNDGVEVLKDLQHVQGQTAAYYQKVAALKAYMNDVNANYGIDVRIPDMSRPESIKLNQIYQTALADIMGQGNLLQQGQKEKMYNTQMGNIYAPGVDPTKQSVATMRSGADYYSKNADALVTELNDKLQMPSYTAKEHADKEALREEKIKEIDVMIKKDPAYRAYWERQKQMIVNPTQGDYRPLNQYTAGDRAAARKVEASGNILSKVTHLAFGAHESFQPDVNKPVGPDDPTPMLVSKEFYGQQIGNNHVDHWELNPKTNAVTLFFKEGGKIEISNSAGLGYDVQELTAQLGNVPIEAVNEYAAKNKLLDKYNQVDRSLVLNPDSGKKRQELIDKSIKERDTNGPAIDQLKQILKDVPFEKGWVWDDEGETGVGPFRIRRTEKNWKITNLDEVFKGKFGKDEFNTFSKLNSVYDFNDQGHQALVKFLTKYGAHIDAYKQKNGAVVDNNREVTPGANPTEVINKGGKKL